VINLDLPQNSHFVYVERGKKRTFAGATEWPGWCRSGRDEEAALAGLCAYGIRYQRVMATTHLEFQVPGDISDLVVIERLQGSSTTDFGAPGAVPSGDARALDPEEVLCLQEILQACWHFFDLAVDNARGHELQKGPRGGGRDLDAMIQHVIDADVAYLRRVGVKFTSHMGEEMSQTLHRLRQVVHSAVVTTTADDAPGLGPQGGVRWLRRYFVRRIAWHSLDHAWEIEDRTL